jgi:hypothetical protein
MRCPVLVLLCIVLATSGCSHLMPPRKIRFDRENYHEAVDYSWKQQLLCNLVRLRYGDTLTSLEMTSVNTAYELDTSLTASALLPWHYLRQGSTSFRNSVTAGASATYMQKPTITYSPLRGDALSKTMIAPIPLSNILKSLQTNWAATYIFPCWIKSINDRRNPYDKKFLDWLNYLETSLELG